LEVTVQNRQRAHRVRPRALAGFLARLAGELPSRGVDSVAVVLVSDRRMLQLNRTYRGRAATTDVLSFPADRGGPARERHLGDIVISVATAAQQARRDGRSLDRELRELALHGYLHLLGYDHETDDGTMRRLERRLRGRLIEAPVRRGRG
jgi:probable rRNA maturation factor